MRALAELQLQDAAVAASDKSRLSGTVRYQVEVGKLSDHLRLAPCVRMEPQWPVGLRPWGNVRVAVRCVDGPTPWKVYLPVTVRAWGQAVVLSRGLPAGTVLEAQHLAKAEVDLAAAAEMPMLQPTLAVGRTLGKAMASATALRASDLRPRQWFGVGESVRIVGIGAGYQVSGEGQAVSPGYEGQVSRVRTESGRIVTGRAVAERLIEVSL